MKYLNLIEAVRTGKRYKREQWEDSHWCVPDFNYKLSPADILADDWIVKDDKQITIKFTDLERAWIKATQKPKILIVGLLDLSEELGLLE